MSNSQANKSKSNQTVAWKHISSKTLLKHSRLNVVEDVIELPSGSHVPYLKFTDVGDAVTLICLKNESVLVQREYCYPIDEILLQFPGGKIEKGESPERAARRELHEESSYTVETLEVLGWYYRDYRRSNSRIFVVLAKDLSSTSQIQGDEEESIESSWVSVKKLESMIKNNGVRNYSMLAGWAMLKAEFDENIIDLGNSATQ